LDAALNARLQAQGDQELAALDRAIKVLNSRSDSASAQQVEATVRMFEAERAMLAAQNGAKSGSQAAVRQKLEAVKAMLAAKQGARNASPDGLLQKLQAERAMIAAEKGARNASQDGRLRKLEAERAVVARVKRMMQDANGRSADPRLRNAQNALKAYEVEYAKQRKAALEREQLELRARLKAIEAELRGKAK
jgi:hypothetical protein